jgi:ribose transport system substrate-binding protein
VAQGAAARRGRARRVGIAAVLATALVTTTVACGSESSSEEATSGATSTQAAGGTSDLLAQAKADAEKATAEVTSFEPWDPGPGPKPEAGLRFGSVSCLWSVPACKRIADGVDAAGNAIGWDTLVLDGTPDQNKQRQAMQSLVARKSQAVVVAALDPHGVGEQLKELNSTKVPWIGVNMLDPKKFGAIGNLDVVGGLVAGGRQLGAWVANDSQGKAKVLMMSSTDNPALQLRDQGFQEYLKQFADIEFVGETKYVPFSSVGPPLQAQVESILQANPAGSIDYIYTPFDGFATFVVNGVQAAGRAGDVKVLGFDGSPQNLAFIRGGRAQVATQATAWGWCSFAAVDALNRVLGGEKFEDKGCPSKVIDKTNVPPEGEVFDGDIDYQAEFKRLWTAG